MNCFKFRTSSCRSLSAEDYDEKACNSLQSSAERLQRGGIVLNYKARRFHCHCEKWSGAIAERNFEAIP